VVYKLPGEEDPAWDSLKRACTEHDTLLTWFKVVNTAMILNHQFPVILGKSIAFTIPYIDRIRTDAISKGTALPG
jgi:hypothetical protein